jgi:hypothetical protein
MITSNRYSRMPSPSLGMCALRAGLGFQAVPALRERTPLIIGDPVHPGRAP